MSKCGAHGSHYISYAILVGSKHIHISFYDDGQALLPYRSLRSVDPVKQTTLIEDRRLGGVKVFGHGVVEYTGTKTNYFPLLIPYGIHQSISKSIPAPSILLDNNHTCTHQLIPLIASPLEMLAQSIPLIGAESKLETTDRFLRDAPLV